MCMSVAESGSALLAVTPFVVSACQLVGLYQDFGAEATNLIDSPTPAG